MGKLRTHEQFIEEVTPVLNHNIRIVGKYAKSKVPIDCICKSCSRPLQKTPESLLKGEGCQKCSAKEMGRIKTKTSEQFKAELYDINPMIEIISEYKGTKEKVKCRCLANFEHHTWSAYPTNLLRNHGCPECALIAQGENKKKTTLNNYLRIFSEYQVELIEDYKGTYEPVLFKCLKCGNVFPASPHKISQNSKGCPICNGNSPGEKIIYKFLTSNNIVFEKEKTFVDFKSDEDSCYRYDFFLPSYNLLLEFNGIQHKQPMGGYFNGLEGYKEQVQHDMIKKEYALNHGYNYFEIWYYDKNNIERILTDYLELNSESVETVMES